MKNLHFIGAPKHSITRDGKVFSHISNRFLTPVLRGEYLAIGLYIDKKRMSFSIHRLVALAYLTNELNKPQVNHIDGDKFNNHISNLEWVTSSENAIHAVETGLKGKVINGYRTISDEDVRGICAMLQDGYRVKDIQGAFNVNQVAVSSIKSGKNYLDISCDFDLDRIPFRQRISTDKIIKICEMLSDKVPMAKIKRVVNVNLGTIRSIKRRECNTFFSSSYKW